MAFDIKALSKNDQGLLISGAVTVVLLFFPAYVKASVTSTEAGLGGLGGSESKSAWVEWATFGTLLLIAAFVLVILKVVVRNVLPAGIPWSLIITALAGLGTLILALYAFTFGPDVPAFAQDTIELSTGPGWSGWVLLIAAIVFTVFAALSFKDSGEKIPEINKGGGNRPQAGPTTPQAGPAAPPVPPAAPPAPPAPPAAGPPAPPAPPTA